MENYKDVIENKFNVQKLNNRCDDYVYQIFMFVYDLLSLMEPNDGYLFYKCCFESALL